MEASSSNKLSTVQFSKYVMDVHDLYTLAERNGYYLPKESAAIITEEFLINVLTKEYYCPLYEDIRLRTCPHPPQKDVLMQKFAKAAKEMGIKNAFIDEVKRPDVKWLVDVIATLNPADEIFRKDYMPPPKRKRLADIETIELTASLFKDMPESKSKAKSRRLKIVSEAFSNEKVARLKQVRKDVENALLEQ
jgi:hypothetical protein